MGETELADLEAAVLGSPGNGTVLRLFLRACVDLSAGARAAAVLDRLSPDAFDAATRCNAAEAYLGAARPEKAVEWAPAEADGAARLLRARALAALGRNAEALADYRDAVRANPTLEDKGLEVQLGATVREVDPGRSGPRLKVIANDATGEDDAVRLLQPQEAPITFADVGGLDDVKEQIRQRIILPFEKPSLFEKFKKRVGGGILLYGPPGCGKTMLARATAGECKARLFAVAISDVLDMYIGESERKLHALFEKARSSKPAVLFFDEIEALGGKRQYSRESTSSKLVSQFLSEMDGFAQNNSGVLVLGATNTPWAVDPAFRRPGRFDRVQFVPPPDRAARESILALLLRGRPVGPDVDVTTIAEKTSGFTGADLQNVVDTAADRAIARSLKNGSEDPIRQVDLVGALREVKSTSLEWLTTARNYARYANESGHYDDVLAFLERNARA